MACLRETLAESSSAPIGNPGQNLAVQRSGNAQYAPIHVHDGPGSGVTASVTRLVCRAARVAEEPTNALFTMYARAIEAASRSIQGATHSTGRRGANGDGRMVRPLPYGTQPHSATGRYPVIGQSINRTQDCHIGQCW